MTDAIGYDTHLLHEEICEFFPAGRGTVRRGNRCGERWRIIAVQEPWKTQESEFKHLTSIEDIIPAISEMLVDHGVGKSTAIPVVWKNIQIVRP